MNVLNMFNGNVDCVKLNEVEIKKYDYIFENDLVSLEGVSIDEFNFDGGELILFGGEGYRGFGYYEGVFKKNGKLFYIDVVNDGCVFEVVD